MARRALLVVALAVVAAAIAAGTASSQVGDVLDPVTTGDNDLNLGGVGIDLPGGGGGGGIDLPGGGGIDLPGGDNGGGGVNLPGGGGIDLSGGGSTEPAPEPTPTAPSDTGGGGGGGGGTGGVAGPSGGGGRGQGDHNGDHRGGDRHGEETLITPEELVPPAPLRNPDGSPTASNPSLTIAGLGPAPLGVPNIVIDQFAIPPFLLPIYQACGTQYGIPWQVLASINRIETAFGTNLNVSTAGAVGWMQFLPSTFEMYGVDANKDGRADPYNPVDAICSAANYLKAAGGDEDIRTGIYAYNHADWYVDEVLLYAREYGNLPEDLIGSLTGLTEGAHFPVAADARYADDISEREAVRRAKPGQASSGNVSDTITSSPTRRGINIYADEGAPVVAVNDGVITETGKSKQLGRYVVLQDAYGNRYTYAQLGHLAASYPAPRERSGATAADYELPAQRDEASPGNGDGSTGPVNTEDSRERLFAFPQRAPDTGPIDSAGEDGERLAAPDFERFSAYTSGILKFNAKTMELRDLNKGSKVVAGTLLGRVGKTDELAPHLNFSIRPAGRGAPTIDPKPILDGWKLLEATAIYRVADKDPFANSGVSIGQILLASKEQLARRVLADPKLSIYECGRQDIQTGQIDRRILALLEYLVARGFNLTITSLKCGHSTLTTSGNVSEHTTGTAVDIAMIDGQPVLGNQGPGSISEALVKDILQLQGSMQPHQIISLMDYFGADNAFAMADHDDHVHVGYAPQYGPASDTGSQFTQILKADQWRRLIGRISEIENPEVPTSPSRFALPTGKQGAKPASQSHVGE